MILNVLYLRLLVFAVLPHGFLRLDASLQRERDELAIRHHELLQELNQSLGSSQGLFEEEEPSKAPGWG